MIKPGYDRLPVRKNMRSIKLTIYRSSHRSRCLLLRRYTTPTESGWVSTAVMMAHQRGPQAPWYNSQSAHELGQSLSVTCTQSIEWTRTLERNTNLGVKTGAYWIMAKGSRSDSSYSNMSDMHAGVVTTLPQLIHDFVTFLPKDVMILLAA